MTSSLDAPLNDGRQRNVMTGGETEVDFDFPIYKDTHLAIYETNTAGVITQLVKDTDFTVPASEVGQQAGGTVPLTASSYPSGATAGHVFTAVLAVPEERTSDFNDAGDFFADVLNEELDLFAQMAQQLRRDVDLTASLPIDTTITDLTLPNPVDSYLLAWDGTTGSMKNVNIATLSDVDGLSVTLSPLSNNDFLVYDSALTTWVNKTDTQVQSIIGLGIGSDVQAYDENLDYLSGLTAAANKGVYFTSASAMSTFDLTAAGRALLDDADAAAQRTTLDVYSKGEVDTAVSGSGPIAAWVQFQGTGTVAIQNDLNVSSITDLGTGQYRVNLGVTMSDAEYGVLVSGAVNSNSDLAFDYGNASNNRAQTTTSVEVNSYSGTSARDADSYTVAILGDTA